MLEIHSPLSTVLTPGRFGAAAGTPPLCFAELPLGGLVQVVGWPGGFEPALAPVLSALGFGGLGDYRQAQRSRDGVAFRIGPERVLLRHADRSRLLAAVAMLDPSVAPSLDLSHARWVISLSGGAGAEFLARLVPLDFHPSAFPIDGFAQTGLHSVSVLLHRPALDRFDILAPITWAASVWDMLMLSAAPFGFVVSRGEWP